MNHLATLINPECDYIYDKKGNLKKTKILEGTYKVLEGTYKEAEEHITKLNQNRKDAKYWKITVINYR